MYILTTLEFPTHYFDIHIFKQHDNSNRYYLRARINSYVRVCYARVSSINSEKYFWVPDGNGTRNLLTTAEML